MTVVGGGVALGAAVGAPEEPLVPEPCGADGRGGGVGSLLSQEGKSETRAAESTAAAQAVRVFFMDE